MGVNLHFAGEITWLMASFPGLGSICNLIMPLETNCVKGSTISSDIAKQTDF